MLAPLTKRVIRSLIGSIDHTVLITSHGDIQQWIAEPFIGNLQSPGKARIIAGRAAAVITIERLLELLDILVNLPNIVVVVV